LLFFIQYNYFILRQVYNIQLSVPLIPCKDTTFVCIYPLFGVFFCIRATFCI